MFLDLLSSCSVEFNCIKLFGQFCVPEYEENCFSLVDSIDQLFQN